MRISKEDKDRADKSLKKIMLASQRSLVSLRKSDYHNLTLDMEDLAGSISNLIKEVGVDFLSK